MDSTYAIGLGDDVASKAVRSALAEFGAQLKELRRGQLAFIDQNPGRKVLFVCSRRSAAEPSTVAAASRAARSNRLVVLEVERVCPPQLRAAPLVRVGDWKPGARADVLRTACEALAPHIAILPPKRFDRPVVFISYNADECDRVDPFVEELLGAGHTVFVDKPYTFGFFDRLGPKLQDPAFRRRILQLMPGGNWKSELIAMVRSPDVVILSFLTQALALKVQRSAWLRREIETAISASRFVGAILDRGVLDMLGGEEGQLGTIDDLQGIELFKADTIEKQRNHLLYNVNLKIDAMKSAAAP